MRGTRCEVFEQLHAVVEASLSSFTVLADEILFGLLAALDQVPIDILCQSRSAPSQLVMLPTPAGGDELQVAGMVVALRKGHSAL